MLNVIGKPFRGRLINRAHPLSDGLIFAPIFNEGEGITVVDSVSGRQGTLTNGPVWYSSNWGWGIDFDGSNDRIDFNPVMDLGVGAFTIIILSRHDVLSQTNSQYLFNINRSGDASYGLTILQSGSSVSGRLLISQAGTSVYLQRLSATSTIAINTPYHLAFTYNGAAWGTYTNYSIFKNGIEVSYGTGTNGSGTRYTGIGKWTVGGITYADTGAFNGKIGGVWVWNRCLSQDEIIQHYGNPYVMFQQPSRAKYSYVAAGGYSLAVDGGSYSQDGQLAALRAARRMSPAPDSYLITGQPVTFPTVGKLAAEGGSYLFTGYDASLLYSKGGKSVKIVGLNAIDGKLVYLIGNLYET